MLETLMAFAKNRVPDYSEKILWCALKYALCMDEGDATEAVIFTLKPKIPEMTDQGLNDMVTAVEQYLSGWNQGVEEKIFGPEWNEVLLWLVEEREKRILRKLAEDEG